MIDIQKVLSLIGKTIAFPDSQEALIAQMVDCHAATTNLHERDCVDTARKLIAANITADSGFSFTECNYQLEIRRLQRIQDAQHQKIQQLERDVAERTIRASEVFDNNLELLDQADGMRKEVVELRSALLACQQLCHSKARETERLSIIVADTEAALTNQVDTLVEEKIGELRTDYERTTVLNEELLAQVKHLASSLKKHIPAKVSCPACSGRGRVRIKHPTYVSSLIGIEVVICEQCRGACRIDNPVHAELNAYLK